MTVGAGTACTCRGSSTKGADSRHVEAAEKVPSVVPSQLWSRGNVVVSSPTPIQQSMYFGCENASGSSYFQHLL